MFITNENKKVAIQKLVEKYGENHQKQIKNGIDQVSRFWQDDDGPENEFIEFCLSNYYAAPEKRDKLFKRLEKNFESLFGNFHRVYREFNWNLHVETGAMMPVDYQFANMNVFAHIHDDFFKSKIAFTILLNFPIHSLDEKNKFGKDWSRRKWAEVRLADFVSERVPAAVKTKRNQAYVAADDYVNQYNFEMFQLLDQNGDRLFPKELKLICHWGLRDEIKAQYALEDGFPRQQLIQKVMEQVIHQNVPIGIVNEKELDWNPFTNETWQSETQSKNKTETGDNRRYELLLGVFKAEQLLDQYTPNAPSLIQRRFKKDREIAELEIEFLFKSILSAPVASEISDLIRQRLNRDLEPFDIWYDGFKPDQSKTENELDELVKGKFEGLSEFKSKLPDVLMDLGFSPNRSKYLGNHIQVDPARGAGHAVGAMLKGDHAHLRTRVPDKSIDYKGFNTAMHELGHSVEQVLSLNEMDYYFLDGVPNTAFTEAFAFAFQERDLTILGIKAQNQEAEALRHLSSFWCTFEIAGVALVDMGIWNWMYQNPQCTATEARDAIITLAKEIWNKFYAPIFGIRDQVLLAVYSHIIDCGMYIPDYPLGHIISFQIEEFIKTRNLAEETERMCTLGKLAPQLWMQEAVGSDISTKPLIDAAEKAVRYLKDS